MGHRQGQQETDLVASIASGLSLGLWINLGMLRWTGRSIVEQYRYLLQKGDLL